MSPVRIVRKPGDEFLDRLRQIFPGSIDVSPEFLPIAVAGFSQLFKPGLDVCNIGIDGMLGTFQLLATLDSSCPDRVFNFCTDPGQSCLGF